MRRLGRMLHAVRLGAGLDDGVDDAMDPGCGRSGLDPRQPAGSGGVVATGPARPTPLRIAAASDLQSALPKLVDRFQAETGIAAVPFFLSSGQLASRSGKARPMTSSYRPTRRSSATWPVRD